MTEQHRQEAIDGIKYSTYTYGMSKCKICKHYECAIIKVTSDIFIKVANDFKSVCRQQPLCVCDGCLTV